MNFYAYIGTDDLGDESCGDYHKVIWKDLKTSSGAVARMKRVFPGKSFTVYSFVNFEDRSTFKKLYIYDAGGDKNELN